jgi:hypothetical protein
MCILKEGTERNVLEKSLHVDLVHSPRKNTIDGDAKQQKNSTTDKKEAWTSVPSQKTQSQVHTKTVVVKLLRQRLQQRLEEARLCEEEETLPLRLTRRLVMMLAMNDFL